MANSTVRRGSVRCAAGFLLAAALVVPAPSVAQPKPAAPPSKPPAGDEPYDTPQPKPDTPYDDDTRTPEQKALARYNDGVDFAKKKDWPHAYDAFLDAWRMYPAVVVAINLTRAEIETERYRDAIDHAQYCLDNAKPNSGNRALAEKWIVEAREKAPKMVLTADTAGASILLDGVLIGTTPASDPIPLNVGDHTVELRLGERGARTAITAESGVTTQVLLRVPPPVTVVLTALPKPPPPPPPPSSSPNTTVLVTGGIVGLTGLSLGLVGAVMSLDAKRTRDDDCKRQIESSGVPCWDGAEADRVLFSRLAAGGFIGGATVLVATAVYYLSTKPEAFQSSMPPVSVSPLLSPTFGGLGLSGNW